MRAGSAGGQSTQTSPSPDTTASAAARHAARRAAREVKLTPALLASAYDGAATRSLIALARSARSADDSAIQRYDATSVERLTVRFAIGPIGRYRMLYRQERAERVRWQRGLGAVVDVTGSRNALPLFPGEMGEVDAEAISLPYVPGRRTLAFGGRRGADTADYAEVDDLIDPLAPGAEAYYRYTGGDSETVRLPTAGGPRQLRLREIRIHARRPIWNLGVGSLWFDASDGHLVRAVYRFAAPMNIVAVARDADPSAFADVPFWVRPMIMPMTANLSAVTLEYSLLNGQYWLPVMRYADGEAHAGPMRLPVRWEVRYRYRSINGPDTLPRLSALTDTSSRRRGGALRSPGSTGATGAGSPALPSPAPAAGLPGGAGHGTTADSGSSGRGGTRLTMRSGAARSGMSDSAERSSRNAQCAQQPTWQHVEIHDRGAARVLVRTPCDTVALAHSSDLPPSLYDDGPQFGVADQTALLKAIQSVPEPDWAPRPIHLHWGPRDNLLRYNRIEGLSAGIAAMDEFGLGLSARAEARFSVADRQPNGEVRLTRDSPLGTIGIGAYRRLDSANDWGDPLSFGSSVWNLLVGDDEGFYYRSWGAELTGSMSQSTLPFTWRLFIERQWSASVETQFALTRALGGAGMARRNLVAAPGTLTGLSFELRPEWGLDPDGLQFSGVIRGEGAGGSSIYARGAADATVTHPATTRADLALTVGAGSSAGGVPPQRFWYLGGLRTVRGLAPGTAVGDAYWLTHIELATHGGLVRPVAFYDLGWAGDRSAWGREGRALSGAGIGASVLEGLSRIDVAKGIWPTHGVRVNTYLQGAF